jgi:hypothetical protein
MGQPRGIKVDVLLRDLDVALYWVAEASQGVYEVDALLGYLAGAPTYTLMAELALNRTVHGRLPVVGEYPEKLSQTALRRWLLSGEFSLAHAQTRAERGDITGTVGQSAKAVMEMGHALACAQHLWVINEKKLVEQGPDFRRCTLGLLIPHPSQLLTWLDGLRMALRRALP